MVVIGILSLTIVFSCQQKYFEFDRILHDTSTVVPTKSDSDVIFCLKL